MVFSFPFLLFLMVLLSRFYNHRDSDSEVPSVMIGGQESVVADLELENSAVDKNQVSEDNAMMDNTTALFLARLINDAALAEMNEAYEAAIVQMEEADEKTRKAYQLHEKLLEAQQRKLENYLSVYQQRSEYLLWKNPTGMRERNERKEQV